MAADPISIDRSRSAERIGDDIDTLGGPEFTSSSQTICRYAYTPAYHRTVEFFATRLKELGFNVYEDPVGNLVARNRPPGQPVFGIGSHCDSNRNGGKYDGTMGVVTALEVCRLNAELELDLPLQLISFLEEEGSGFGQLLLGSRIMAGRVDARDLRERFLALDDGRSFWEHAEEAGRAPARWRESAHVLDDLVGWIELHIEQGRTLQDTGHRIGVVTAIAGYMHADVQIHGRADHAGATPMTLRKDAAPTAAACVLELERLASEASRSAPTVGTVGEISLDPGIINVVPGQARFTMDIRGVSDDVFRGVFDSLTQFAHDTARRRDTTVEIHQRQFVPATPMDTQVRAALDEVARAIGEPHMSMHSGAAHDTMCVADRVPTGMLFVPCRDGISHDPAEEVEPADAALGAEIMTTAIAAFTRE